MDPERLTALFGTELSDEAAAQLADFFHELALCFETCYFSKIRRHHRAARPQRDEDPAQIDRFGSPGEPF